MNNFFIWHLFLAWIWGFALGNLSVSNLAVGFVLGYLILWLCRHVLETERYCIFVLRLGEFVLFFLKELWVSNIRVAGEILTPTHYMRPGIIALPLDVTHDVQITLLASLINLTPGTLSLEVSEDRKYLYVHAMYVPDPEREKQHLKQGLERRILELSR